MAGKPSIPDAESASIIARYKAGESTEEIGKTYGKHRDTIRSFLVRRGIRCVQLGGHTPIGEEREEEVVQRYLNGEGAPSIADSLDVDKRTIYNVLIRRGIGTRPRSDRNGTTYHFPDAAVRAAMKAKLGPSRHHQKPFNEHAFDEITEASAYWIGFLMADGCISAPVERSSRRLFVQLSIKDLDHLEKFRDFLGASNEVRFGAHLDPAGNEKQHCAVAVTSNHLTAKLIEYGVTPRKTATAKVCAQLAHDRHFWRGVVDGDGSVYYDRKFYVAGSSEMMDQFMAFAGRVCKHPKIVLRKQPGCVRAIPDADTAEALLISLYRNSLVFLPRKKLSAGTPRSKWKNPDLSAGVLRTSSP